MTSATKFRVWGGVIGEDVPYLDVDVTGIDDESGDLYFTATGTTIWSDWAGSDFTDDGTVEHTITVETYRNLLDDGLLVNRETMPGTTLPVWVALDALQTQRNAVSENDSATDRLDTSMEFIFRAIAQFA